MKFEKCDWGVDQAWRSGVFVLAIERQGNSAVIRMYKDAIFVTALPADLTVDPFEPNLVQTACATILDAFVALPETAGWTEVQATMQKSVQKFKREAACSAEPTIAETLPVVAVTKKKVPRRREKRLLTALETIKKSRGKKK